MSEKVKSGLLVLIAGLLVVNTVLLIQQDTPAIPSASNKFERSADNKVDAKPVVKDNTKLTAATDPMSLAAEKPAGPTTSVNFAETTFDFGNVSQDSENTKVFTFTNTGSEPLVIENAKGSCGCTVPKYPKEPIAPGATGEIEVVYKPGKQQNKQTKTVTITANTDPAKSVLTITADVAVAGV